MNHFILKIAMLGLALAGPLLAADSETSIPSDSAVIQPPKPLFTAQDAETAFAAFNQAFYVVNDGKSYYKETTTGGRNQFWTQAEEIEMILDTYERTRSPDHKPLINESINGFVDKFGTNWLSNKYNDDLMWMVIAEGAHA
jgi:predicted alpha-1,6-mannanase (GH76 family)